MGEPGGEVGLCVLLRLCLLFNLVMCSMRLSGLFLGAWILVPELAIELKESNLLINSQMKQNEVSAFLVSCSSPLHSQTNCIENHPQRQRKNRKSSSRAMKLQVIKINEQRKRIVQDHGKV